MDPSNIALLTVAGVFTLVLLGVHIGVALALLSVIGIWAITGKLAVAVSLLNTTAYQSVMDYIFAVIPLFVLMGILANLSGATRDLFSSAQILFGRIRGGLGIATVIANAVFAAITGVSVASAAVFSKLAIPEMLRLEYDRKFAYGIVAGSAILGMLIPPSILMIVYGVLTEQSIGKLFAAGIGPGLVVSVILSLGIWLRVRLNPALARQVETGLQLTRADVLRAALKPWAVVLLIALVLGGLYGGLFTPTEAGAIGAAGALVLVVAARQVNLQVGDGGADGHRPLHRQHLPAVDRGPDVQPDADDFGAGLEPERVGRPAAGGADGHRGWRSSSCFCCWG